MKGIFRLLLVLVIMDSILAPISAQASSAKTLTFQAEGWADNWFSLYINGKKVGEDSVPITTVRSFNSTKIKFSASYPFTVGVVVKDYVENASGLEYIGAANQQIGDGGFALQIRELGSNKIIAVTNRAWKTMVVNKAPLNVSCVSSQNPLQDCKSSTIGTPSNWAASSFNDSKWSSATEFTADEVGVKDGYLDITWSPDAKLIWSSDLKIDNTILMRTKVTGVFASKTSTSLTVKSASLLSDGTFDKSITCDGAGLSPQVSWEGAPAGTQSFYVTMDTVPGPLRPGEVAAPDHSYFNLFAIPSSSHSLASGKLTPGTLGLNFKSPQPGYEPPCSQGPGAKIYTITVYALSFIPTIAALEARQSNLLKVIEGKILAQGKISGTYSRA
jgi:phosphatidylethanolamine-binding protein (PEBP) family uncharacterized protein